MAQEYNHAPKHPTFLAKCIISDTLTYMATIHKRTMVSLPEEVRQALETLAKKKNKSVSRTAAELLEFALNIQEDVYLDEVATERMREPFKTKSHDDVWK